METEDLKEMFDRKAYMINKFWVRNMPDHLFKRMLNLFLEENVRRERKDEK